MTPVFLFCAIVVVGLLVVMVLSSGTPRRKRYNLDDEDTNQVGNVVGGDLAGRNINKQKPASVKHTTQFSPPKYAPTPAERASQTDSPDDATASFLAAAVWSDPPPAASSSEPDQTPAKDHCSPGHSDSHGHCIPDTSSSPSHDGGSSHSHSDHSTHNHSDSSSHSYDSGSHSSYDSGSHGGGYDGGSHGGGFDGGGSHH